MLNPDWNVPGTLAKAQRDAIINALKDCYYSHSAAAQRLRIGRSTIYRLIERYQIHVPEERRRRPLFAAATTRTVKGKDVWPKVILEDGVYLLVNE
jgi:transposase